MEEFEVILQQIAAKEPEALREADIAFLRARASYLSEEDKKKFAKILGEEVEPEEQEQENLETEEVKPKARKRKTKE